MPDKDNRLKSAVEIAMERLRDKDREAGVAAPRALSEEQKEAIAEVRGRYEAKVAEMKILHDDALRKAAAKADAEKMEELQEENRRELAELAEKRDAEIEAVRGRTD